MAHASLRLSCGHYVRKDVKKLDVGADVHCHFCGWQLITDILSQEWHVACRSCRYGAWTGQDMVRADRLMFRHLDRNPGHDVHAVYEHVSGEKSEDVPLDGLTLVDDWGRLFLVEQPTPNPERETS